MKNTLMGLITNQACRRKNIIDLEDIAKKNTNET